MGKRWWEKRNQGGRLYLFIAIILSTLMFVGGVSWIAWAGIQAENGIYGWYAAGSKWVKFATTSTGSINTNVAGDLTPADGVANPTTAIRSGSYNFGYNGTTWDRLKTVSSAGSTSGVLAAGLYSTLDNATWLPVGATLWTGGLSINTLTNSNSLVTTSLLGGRNVVSSNYVGSSMSYANKPEADAVASSYTHLATQADNTVYDGTYWRFAKDAAQGDNLTNGVPVNGLYGYDGTNWDRVKIDANGSLYVNPGALAYTTDTITVYPPDPSYSHISTNTSTQVKSAAGYLMGISVNTAGASANTITLYNNTSCATTVIGVIDGTIAGNIDLHGLKFATGLCITTATGTAPDLTVVYK